MFKVKFHVTVPGCVVTHSAAAISASFSNFSFEPILVFFAHTQFFRNFKQNFDQIKRYFRPGIALIFILIYYFSLLTVRYCICGTESLPMMKFIDFQTLNSLIQGDPKKKFVDLQTLQSVKVGKDTFGYYMDPFDFD